MKQDDDCGAAHLPAPGVRAWIVVGLASCTQAVSQLDQAVVGLAAEPIMEELSLSTASYGIVAGSLYTFYALGGIVIGLLAAPRFSPRSILIVLLLLWSLSQLPIVLTTSLSMLVACRMLLGAAGGAGTATSMNVCHEWFPDTRRALPGALMIMGGTIGSMLGAPALTYIIFNYGWRYAFLACSLLGLLVMGGWLLVSKNGPYAARRTLDELNRGSGALLRRLLRDQTIVGNAIVGLCAYWIVGFMVAWLALYVRDQGEMSPMSSGWVLSLIFLGQSVMVVGVAGLSQRLLAAGQSSRIARSYALVGCLLGSAACFVGMAFIADTTTRMFLVMLATALAASVFPLSAAMITEVAPGTERYRLMTIIFAIVTLAGLVSPGTTGALVELGETHGWRPALLLTAAIGLAGGFAGLRLLHPAATIAAFASVGKDEPDTSEQPPHIA